MTPFESNLERLLREAYQPETPDPAFVTGLQERLRATAQQRAATQAGERRTVRVRRCLGWAMAAAAVVVAIGLVQYARRPRANSSVSPMIAVSPDDDRNEAAPEHLTPQPKAPAPKVQVLAVGENLHTEPGQRRRVQLPDGSVLFVNAGTSLKLESSRRVVLEHGEVFVEVAPRADERFVVRTRQREVTALGTKFTVKADLRKTSIAVTQGKVKVSGLASVLEAGQQLDPDANRPAPVRRITQPLEWTRDLMTEADSPLVPGSNYGGGKLLAFDAAGQEAKISLRKYHLDVHIEDGFARTTIDQTYFNHEQAQLEGTFYFPLPPDASISRLAMYVDGNLMEGGMAERDHARDTFEQIRYARRDPALLEWLDGSTFKMRVFPLEARQEKRIVLSYTQRLVTADGKATYRFPAGHDLRVVGDWSTSVRIANAAGIGWASPSHTLSAANDGTALVLTAAAKSQTLDRDLVLELTEPTSAPATRFSTADLDGQRYLMLRQRVEIGGGKPQAEMKPTHYVFLFETSADRDPLLARTQIEILRTILDNLEHSDTFHILTAGTRTKLLSEKPLPATAENIKRAIAALEKVHLVGALDLEGALDATVPLLKDQVGAWLIHIGSGIPALGLRREDELAKRLPSGVRYAGIGVGKRWGRAFMRSAAERTGGNCTQINPDEAVAWRAFDFLAGLRLRHWQNLSLIDDAGRIWLPADASVASGEELCAVTRFAADEPLPKQVVIRGTVGGKPFEQKVNVENVAANAGYIPRTWGKLEIDRLLAADSAANKAKIVELSKAMYVMSPFTSLLVLENDAMYKQFNVDRGRKDHWAMYPCPAKIPVVREPLPSNANMPVAASVGRRSTRDVLQSIMVRNARYVWTTSGAPGKPCTALELLTPHNEPGALEPNFIDIPGRKGDPNAPLPIYSSWPQQGGFYAAMEFTMFRQQRSLANQVVARRGLIDVDGSIERDLNGRFVFPAPGSLPIFVPNTESENRFGNVNRHLGGNREPGRGWTTTAQPGGRQPANPQQLWNYYRVTPNAFGGGNGFGGANGTNFALNFTNGFGGNNGGFGGGNGGGNGGFGGQGGGFNFNGNGFGMGGQFGFGAGQFGFNGMGFGGNWNGINGFSGQIGNVGQFGFQGFTYQILPNYLNYWYVGTPLTDQYVAGLVRTKDDFQGPAQRTSSPPLFPDLTLYPTTAQTVNWRMVLSDLVAQAPGMETSMTDILAAVEAEAADLPPAKPGHIDDAARKLIERSRQSGWRTHTVSGLTLTYDGAGRFAFTRTLPSGLRETVVNDGATLLHLYPEIGVGARRTMHRLHRAEFAGLLPGALPPADDLARGADVVAVDEHTVAVIPLGDAAKKAEVRLTFGDDGRMIARELFDSAAKKSLHSERFDKVKSALAPNLKPDVAKLVVLPLPYRTVDSASTLALTAKPADADHLLLAAHFAASPRDGSHAPALHDFVTQRRISLGAKPGLATLLRAGSDLTPIGFPSPFHDSDNLPLSEYMKQVVASDQYPARVPTTDGLLPQLVRLHNLSHRWSRQFQQSDAAGRKLIWNETRDFAERNRNNEFGWLAVVLAGLDRGFTQDEWRGLAELWRLFDADAAHGYAARWECMTCLLRGGLPNTARMLFDDIYRQTLERGQVPPLNDGIKSLPANEAGVTWEAMLLKTVGDLSAKGRAADALAVAEQCHTLGGAPLARQAFGQLAGHLDGFPIPLRFAATLFLARSGDRERAEALLHTMLNNKEIADDPLAWRLAADLAAQGGSVARKVMYLERALDLEYAHLPEVMDVQSLRQDYDALLTGYADWVNACRMADATPPTDLVARVIKFTDRWRSIDPDPTLASQKAGRALRLLGRADLAWEYLTTPLAGSANEAAPFKALADELLASNEPALAERALAAAFAAEPTNAQLLWDRAMLLQQMGRTADARPLLERLADGTWQPRFDGLRNQARAMLSR